MTGGEVTEGHCRAEVQYARERIRYQGRGTVLGTLGLLQDVTVGYGYRPRRALSWLAVLLVTGSIVFSTAPPPAMSNGEAPHFNGIVYAVDLMLPVAGNSTARLPVPSAARFLAISLPRGSG